ncbi:MAG: THUMP domain-containing protein [Nanoarchaeota archaeon]
MKIATCLEGIEDIVESEVKGKKIARGRVKFDSEVKDFRSVNDVYEILAEFKFRDIEDIEREASKLELNIKGNVKIECTRDGDHKFNSVDVEKAIGSALQKRGIKTSYKNFDSVLIADVVDNLCIIGIPVAMKLNKRNYRVRINNQGVHPCLAYAMLRIAGYKENSVLLDPFCKDATILIEAALLHAGKIYGIDFNRNNIRNAEINTKMAKVEIKLNNAEMDWVDTFFKKGEIDFIVSYPIFESKRRRGNIVKNVLTEFFHQAGHVLKGKIVLLSPDKKILDYANNFKIKEERKIKIGKSNFFIFALIPG